MMIKIKFVSNLSGMEKIQPEVVMTKSVPEMGGTSPLWGIVMENDKYSIISGTIKDGVSSTTAYPPKSGKTYGIGKGVVINSLDDARRKVDTLVAQKEAQGWTKVEEFEIV